MKNILSRTIAAGALLSSAYSGQMSQGGKYDIGRALVERIKLELLWQELPYTDKALSTRGVLTLAFQDGSPGRLIYCSHDLGGCGAYQVWSGRLDQRIGGEPCSDKGQICRPREQDIQSLTKWAQRQAIGLDSNAVTVRVQEVGAISRAAVLREYKGIPPSQTSLLQEWITRSLQDSKMVRVEIPCFRAGDPYVWVYGVRLNGEQVMILMAFHPETGWRYGGIVESARNAHEKATVLRMKAIVGSIGCAVVQFQ